MLRLVVSVAVLLTTVTVFAADTAPTLKVAYVDLQKALQSVDAGKTAKSQLEKDVASKRAELEKAQTAFQAEVEQLEKKAAILNDSAKQQKQAELQKKYVELQKNAQETQMDLQKRERELTKPLIDELRAIIEGIGKEKGYQLILEKNEGAVLYAEAGSDLTSDVIEKFNKTHKGKSKEKKK